METQINKAICLRSADYGDNDKILQLFSVEFGRISVVARGVKKSDAKLKFCAQPFCFGEYETVKKGDRYLVTGCKEIESFFNIGKNPDGYYCAACAAEFVSCSTQEGDANPALFVLLARCLNFLNQNPANPKTYLIKFLLDALKEVGYGLDFSACNQCGRKTDRMYVDMSGGGVVCDACKNEFCQLLSPSVLNTFRQISDMDSDRLFVLKTEKYDGSILAVLALYVKNMIKKLNSIQFLY